MAAPSGRRKTVWMIWPAITSSGCPFFSYMASRNRGSMATIMQTVAVLELTVLRSKKKSGTQ